MAGEIHRDDRLGPRRDRRLETRGVDVERVGSTSTKTGVAPRCTITLAVEANVIGEVIDLVARPDAGGLERQCSAAVQEFTPTRGSAPTYAASVCSNCFVRGPVVIQPERSTSSTARSSSSSISG